MHHFYSTLASSAAILSILFTGTGISAADKQFELKQNDHVVYIGNTLADRMQHSGWLESYLQALYPTHNLTFRNLGFPGDEVVTRPRSANFGTADEWITKCEADVVFCFFGYNEALRGESELPKFETDLKNLIEQMRAQKYNGASSPRLVICSPIAHENLHSRHLPDGSDNNRKLSAYTAAMKKVCEAANVTFVDLFTPSQQFYVDAEKPLTMNGIHLLDHGNQIIAGEILHQLLPQAELPADDKIQDIRDAVLDKNYHWFSRYRVVDGYNVYGGRSKLAWFGQSNADVMKREMEIFDVMTANRDQKIWSIAQGKPTEAKDDNLPEELAVRTNKPGPLEGERFAYLKGDEAISQMKVHPGMQVNLFASEEKFPRLVNPVQISFDTDSRLWASVWPSYPHWNPTEPRQDAILIFPDDDNNGEADECIVFADELNSITGFEFWGGGVLVAAPPEIWFLKDTDGDDRADVKIRLLQGISSADTHHSANAMLVGPDGWLYWSRGIFNVANFETPTKTYRSGQSGVHRFNPRTFEVEFHFPIGPNPHGDIIDQWGYQFASDGTSGTGSYINIGKGVGNKQWYKKRVRPVPAIGSLSSSHFPPELDGNFLIANAIGFLGVLQHEVKYDGADITATEIEPILVSSDQNFRPSDLEIGGDGALYVADWHNVLIGHMQHNMRDPNRDHDHGRIYRVTYPTRPLVNPPKMKDKPIAQVCENFFSKETSTRYRARLELSGRPAEQITEQVGMFAAKLDPAKAHPDRNEAQALLECLWVFEEQRLPNEALLQRVFQAAEPRIRAAAIRTLGHWSQQVSAGNELLLTAARDESPLVRAEAVKAAVDFQGVAAVEAIFEVLSRSMDPELEAVVKFAKSQLNLDTAIEQAIASGTKLSPAALSYAYKNARVASLEKLPPTEQLYRAILSREDANASQLDQALTGLSDITAENSADLLFHLLGEAQAATGGNVNTLGSLLLKLPPEALRSRQSQIEKLAVDGSTQELKRVAYAAWVAASGPDDAFLAASVSKERLQDFLDAVPSVEKNARGALYDKVAPLVFELPSHLEAEAGRGTSYLPGIHVDYYYPSAANVALETLDAMQPKASGVVPEIVMNVPQLEKRDKFALKFTGMIVAPTAGEYTFSIASDDGSRIYLGDSLLVNNDGLHGMVEKSGKVSLTAGAHPLTVTYFDNGGGDGLRVQWAGPGFGKQSIAPESLVISGGETLHDVAIRALDSIPGHEEERFSVLARVVKSGRHLPVAIHALGNIPAEHWPKPQIRPLVDNLIGYLTTLPPQSRTSGPAVEAMALAKALSKSLPKAAQTAVLNRLDNLDIRVIAIGTVSHRMIFDKELIAVQAGKPVEFRFSNTDAMPHNFAITVPGALQEVGELAEETGRDADAMERHYIPESDKILLSSHLLQPGESQSLSFEVPKTPGVYPYVCTYPGHWRRMYGALYVVENLQEYDANQEAYLAKQMLPIKDELLTLNSRSHEWKYDELIGEVKKISMGRSFEVGKQLFNVASCTGCHKLDNEGRVFGPDLTQLAPEKQTLEHLLRSIVEPSKEIDPKYQSQTFVLDSGKVITGMVTQETPTEIHVVIDPLAKGKPTILLKDEIEAQKKSDLSLMPQGLLNKLTQEEILDLIAFVMAKGDKKHKLFHGHHHH